MRPPGEESAGDCVRLIRAFAESTAKPSIVYNLAQIPPPASPSPAPPPAQPTDLTVTLDASGGNLTLRWKALNPAGTSGTSYIIRRRRVSAATLRPSECEFHFARRACGRCQTLQRLGKGKKELTDDTVSFGPEVREGIQAPACSTPCRASGRTRAGRGARSLS